MRHGLSLSTIAVITGFGWLMGCASGGANTTDVTGTGTGGTGGSGSTTSATTTSSTTSTTSTTSSSASTGGGGTGGATSSSTTSSTTSTGTGGMPNPGLPLGSDCTQDSDCDSMLCKPVVIGVNPVCVQPCTQQSDCGGALNFFCEPITAGDTNGYCIPHSPAHCLSCTQDSDCGSLSEVCFQAPGDIAKACHIDCSLSNANACPQDYSCTDQMVNGQARKLCRPNIIPTCLDAVGGFCDRLTLPQPCLRTNTAGTCIGQRPCLAGVKRFDKCGATAPQCKTDCAAQDPAGCMEQFCGTATSTPQNCGMCGKTCAGYMKPNDNVTCQNGTTCTFSCQGENYDVDNDTTNGCEAVDAPQGNHTQSSAATQGSVSDCDSGGVDFTFTGKLLSDKRVHEMAAVVGYDTASGSAPDFYTMIGVGHTFCQNDLVMTLTVQNSISPACYKLTVTTDKVSYNCTTSTSGTCSFSHNGGGQFSDDTAIIVEVQKTCSTNVNENITYTVSGHL